MTEEPESLILELLRQMRAELGDVQRRRRPSCATKDATKSRCAPS